MANPALKITERRSEDRVPAQFDLTSLLKKIDSDDPIRSILVDISTIGIGIKSFDYLKTDSVVRLTSAGEEVRFRVAWSKPDRVKEKVWHIGLLVIEPTIDLKVWFAHRNLVLDSIQTNISDHQGGTGEAGFSFSAIRDAISAAHSSDRSFFTQSGLEELMGQRCAFPIRCNGMSLVVLLPKELKPQQVGKMSDKEAESEIAVFRRTRNDLGDSRWTLIWPC